LAKQTQLSAQLQAQAICQQAYNCCAHSNVHSQSLAKRTQLSAQLQTQANCQQSLIAVAAITLMYVGRAWPNRCSFSLGCMHNWCVQLSNSRCGCDRSHARGQGLTKQTQLFTQLHAQMVCMVKQ